ncbi:DUF1223 domain-containing protein [Microvirga sp. SYSU G3D207]|uniref:DUF1223 domain-containing protein n=2 Tax=Microvirga arsenatis TaxID=2692265 RepID=A0ABW9YY77_9HYPH|nr:DUF1223 domain-containing protein [Microvirga arsenatis]NBJ24812.1 DUF1223 domain-containing protein [Microvirga arsenatis]
MFHGGIMASRLRFFPAALALAALLQPARAEQPRAVVELFTSQGCSSCPPADALLVEYSRQPDIVALSLPVNYWDYLGWKDTLAHVAFTERQKAYAHSRKDRQVFTPQMIVNGKKSSIGSDRDQIEQAIQATTKGRKALPVQVKLSETNGTVTIAVEETPDTAQREGEIWVLPVLRSQTVPIERGENRGKTITYANVVRGLNRVGEWRGGSARFEVPLETALKGGDGYVVLLQSTDAARPGVILGAAKGPGL